MALKQDIGVPCSGCKTCMGFKIHGWKKFCVDCNCSVDLHDITDESTLSILDEMKLFDKPFYSAYQESLHLASKVHKSWLPIGLKYNEIDEFVSLLPNMCDKGSEERCRKRNLRLQIPVTDRCVEKFCHLDTSTERQVAEKFILNRNNCDIGLGYIVRITDDNRVCADCQISLRPNTLSVTTDHNSNSKQFWHPYCFKCTTCQELLVDYIYVSHNNRIYCVRHYANVTSSRCNACDEIICSPEYTRFNNENFHTNHFACSICDMSVAKQNYINYDNCIFCKSCYEVKYGKKCYKCQELITYNSMICNYDGLYWHAQCFLCCHCNLNLNEKLFGRVNSNLYCEKCHQARNLPRCESCHEHIDFGMRAVERDEKKWHVECHLCDECKSPLSAGIFVYQDNKSICMPCFDSKFCKKCAKCDKIVRGGVSYNSLKYHPECFTCYKCSSSIVSKKFSTKNNLLYCINCYEQQFCETCAKCTESITGMPVLKFDDKYWHVGCINCCKCDKTVSEKCFVRDRNVYCHRCLL